MNIWGYVHECHIINEYTGAWAHGPHVGLYIRQLTNEYMGLWGCPRG
jgi:hypothetical protein